MLDDGPGSDDSWLRIGSRLLDRYDVRARLGAGARSGLKVVGSGVSEWKIDWGPGLRIYLAFDGTRLVILLGGGTKTRQQPDIEEALLRWADYKRRKAEKE